MPKNILVIDDEPLVTKSLGKLLRVSGYNAFIAASAQEALEKIKETTFDLIISDIRMPGTNGIEAISQIREYLKQDKKAQVPEIFITGYASEENYKQAIQLKVAEYIYKPFDMNELLDIIKRHLG